MLQKHVLVAWPGIDSVLFRAFPGGPGKYVEQASYDTLLHSVVRR